MPNDTTILQYDDSRTQMDPLTYDSDAPTHSTPMPLTTGITPSNLETNSPLTMSSLTESNITMLRTDPGIALNPHNEDSTSIQQSTTPEIEISPLVPLRTVAHEFGTADLPARSQRGRKIFPVKRYGYDDIYSIDEP